MQTASSMVGRYSRLVNDIKNDHKVLRQFLEAMGQLVEEITWHPILLTDVDDTTIQIYEEFKMTF